MSRSTYVIADIGANHDGDRRLMSHAIWAAKRAGCNAVKFQWVSDPRRMAKRRGAAEQDGYAAIYARYLNCPREWLGHLAAECAETGIDFMCTAFLPEDVEVVAPHVAKFKVASFEAGDRAFLKAHGGYEKEVLVSTGMLSGGEVRVLDRTIIRGSALRLLHCVSAYPTPVAELSLGVLWARDQGGSYDPDFRRVFDGFSDHTDPSLTWTGALAVAAGAEIVEAHLRLDETDPTNPDFAHAMTPRQFEDYVRHVRFAETCLGDGEKRQRPCEAAMARYKV